MATAYIVVEPDTDGFAEKLKADLEKYDFTLKIDVDPDMDGFAEKVQAEVDALKGDDVKIPIDPDADGFREKVAAETAGEPPVEVPVTPGPFEEKLAAVIERSRVFVAASGGDVIPVSFEVNEGSFVRIAALTAALAEAQKKLGDSMGGGMSSMERAITASLQYGQALELLINREGMMADESHLAAKSFAGDWQSAVAQANADLENATSHIEASGAAINSFGEDAAGAIAPLRALADASGTYVAAAMNKTDQAAKEGATLRILGDDKELTALAAVVEAGDYAVRRDIARAREEGIVTAKDRVLLVVTGNGLKDVAGAASKAAPATMDAEAASPLRLSAVVEQRVNGVLDLAVRLIDVTDGAIAQTTHGGIIFLAGDIIVGLIE